MWLRLLPCVTGKATRADRCTILLAFSDWTRLPLPVNETFAALGLLGWKPIIAALLLPPVPWLVMAVMAMRLVGRRHWFGGWLLALALVGGWLSHCQAVGQYLETLVSPANALSEAQVVELKRALPGRRPVILVLGGGVQALAPEYGEPHLSDSTFQRLHYGMWLSRQLQAPVMVSGGLGYGQVGGPTEAAVANRIAQRDYGATLRWQETASRDTRENARFSLLMLRKEGITDLLLVTHGWHMARSLRAFQEEAARIGFVARIVPAPVGLAESLSTPVMRWMPSPEGYRRVHRVLRELLGRVSGA